MSKNAPIALVIPAISAVLGTLGPAASHPAPGVAGVADHVIATGRSATLRYWTSERMQRALAPPRRPRPRPMAYRPAPGPPIT
ncbi:MAG: hypothetical protein JWR24_4514, partial [Actinoallomurus sp.]|nr:hypothetical protein [Actinoallomurus sp.]